MNVDLALKHFFKLQRFRPGQKEIVVDILNKFDCFAMLPTGSGKSLCYQLPAFMLEGVTIVVSPLLSLMEDQVQQLRSNGFKQVVALNSFLRHDEREVVLKQLHKQKIIYVSPEILQSSYIMNKLKRLSISLFVVDEAHCISQWGHEFRTDYLKLAEVRKELGNPPCLALTATATSDVQKDIIEKLRLTNYKTHTYSIDRPNIAMVVAKGLNSLEEKIAELVYLVQHLEGPGIIYTSTRKWAEDLTTILSSKGIEDISAYHGGMSNEDRILIQQQFLNNELQLICCTSAFGMGVNKANIRYVIHFHYPLQLEAYLQEIGRAGRDGEKSIAITLYTEEEASLQLSLLTKEFPTSEQIEQVFVYLKDTVGKLDEGKLISITGITETMWRFFRYHFEKQGVLKDLMYQGNDREGTVIKAISETIMNRITYKRQKLMHFKQWLSEHNQCRRRLLLEHFGDEIDSRITNCCDICGINLEDYFGLNHNVQRNTDGPWQLELKKIFHQ